MTLIVDSAALVALADAREPRREQVLAVMLAEPGPLIVPAPALAEVDYILGQSFGRPARRAMLADVAAGRFTVACLEREEYLTVTEVEARYEDLDLGLVDCAIVVLAERYRCDRLLTFDERHFRVVAPLQGGAFVVLPADA